MKVALGDKDPNDCYANEKRKGLNARRDQEKGDLALVT